MIPSKKVNYATLLSVVAFFYTTGLATNPVEPVSTTNSDISAATKSITKQDESLYATEEEINAAVDRVDVIDPRLIIFSTVGSTYMADYEQASGKVNLVFCNSCDYDETKPHIKNTKRSPRNIRSISKPSDLENLIPVRETTKFTLPEPAKIDKKYPGCRTAYMGMGLEKLFKAIGIYPDMHYEGQVLIDQYKEGLPLKLSLNNVNELRSLLSYYTKNLLSLSPNGLEFPAASQRPLLVLDCPGLNTLDANEKELVKSLFVVADPKNARVKTFLADIMKNYLHAVAKDGDPRKEWFGETLLRKIEENTCKLDMKNIAIATVMGTIGVLVITRIIDYAKAFNNGLNDRLGNSIGDSIYYRASGKDHLPYNEKYYLKNIDARLEALTNKLVQNQNNSDNVLRSVSMPKTVSQN